MIRKCLAMVNITYLILLLLTTVSVISAAKQKEHDQYNTPSPVPQNSFRCWSCKSAANLSDCQLLSKKCISKSCYSYNDTQGRLSMGCGTCGFEYPPSCERCKTTLCVVGYNGAWDHRWDSVVMITVSVVVMRALLL